MENSLPKYISRELEFTGVDPFDYSLPVLDFENVSGVLDARYWSNKTNSYPVLILLVSVSDGRKLKFIIFRNKKNRLYTPNSKDYDTFCCEEKLTIYDKIKVTYGKSNRSDKIYLRSIDVIL